MKPINAWMAAPGVALVAGAMFVASESPDPHRVLVATLAGIGVLLVWGAAMSVRSRHPDRPLWMLLCALAVAYSMQYLVSSPEPFLFTLSITARPASEILLVTVMLAYPTGRLPASRERAIALSMVVIFLLLWLPGVMVSSRVPIPGGFVTCVPRCPDNLLFVADDPQRAAMLLGSFRILGVLILALASLHLFQRLRRASPLMRRALLPVLLAAIARALYIATFLATGGWTALSGSLPTALSPDNVRIAALTANSLTFWAVPMAIVWGMLRGRLYTARALERLVGGLRRRPAPAELRVVMADALDDPELEIGYRDESGTRWVDAFGREVILPPEQAINKAARILNDADGRPTAVLVHDRALLEEPLLLDAVASSMQDALFSHQAELAVAGQKVRTASAVEEERRRIERDLHDGAQQRLLAIRMKLGVSKRLLEHDARRAESLMAEMDADIGVAIAEMRALAHGVVPPLLAEGGLAAALADAASHAAIPVALELKEVGRFDPAVERAVYYCCLEALQNAAKHAGPEATARVALSRDADALHFSVEDSGPGLALGNPPGDGQGMRNIRERLAAVGGQLEIGAGAASGLRISGTVPCARA